MKYRVFISLLLAICAQACSEESVSQLKIPRQMSEASQVSDHASSTGRWYTQAQLQSGEQVYQSNCLVCHKKKATGTAQWKKTLADGSYPPPPLNGSAHAWHHDIETLTRYIKNGGVPLGGVMPGFKNKLSEQEVLAVIAYFQSYWDDNIYSDWLSIGGVASE